MAFVVVTITSALVGSRVRNAVHTGRDVDTCLLGNLQLTAVVPVCASDLVKNRGHYFSVLLGITSATRVARQQSNPNTNTWCALQADALQAYERRSAYSEAEQSVWMTRADIASIDAASAVCR